MLSQFEKFEIQNSNSITGGYVIIEDAILL